MTSGTPNSIGVATEAPTAELTDLADAVRSLIDATVRTEMGPEALRLATTFVEQATAELEPELRDEHYGLTARREGSQRLPFGFNPVLGRANPLAPPVELEDAQGLVVGHATMGRAYEGPPNHVHGGVISLVLDQTLGLANLLAGHSGMTVDLHLRYLRPTPLFVPVRFESWWERTEGRKIHSRGRVLVEDEVTVEAEGLFLSIQREQSERLYTGTSPT